MLLSNKYRRLGAISLHIALPVSYKPLQYFFIEVFSKVSVAVVACIWWSPTKIFLLAVGAASTPTEFWDWNIWLNNWIIWQIIEIFDKVIEIFNKIFQVLQQMEPVRGGQDRPPCLAGLITRRMRVVSPESSKSEQCFCPNSQTQYDNNHDIHDLTQRHLGFVINIHCYHTYIAGLAARPPLPPLAHFAVLLQLLFCLQVNNQSAPSICQHCVLSICQHCVPSICQHCLLRISNNNLTKLETCLSLTFFSRCLLCLLSPLILLLLPLTKALPGFCL